VKGPGDRRAGVGPVAVVDADLEGLEVGRERPEGRPEVLAVRRQGQRRLVHGEVGVHLGIVDHVAARGAAAPRVLVEDDEGLAVLRPRVEEVRVRDVGDDVVVEALPCGALAGSGIDEDQALAAVGVPLAADLVGAQGHAVLLDVEVRRRVEEDPAAVLVGPHLGPRVVRLAARPADPADAGRRRDQRGGVLHAEELLFLLRKAQDLQGVAHATLALRIAELPLLVDPGHQEALLLELVAAGRDHLVEAVLGAQLAELRVLPGVPGVAPAVRAVDAR